jgi:AraC family transcriptional regulator of adaptative response/methylated-DNA-[protein]-cysteine methyltransferase
VWKALLMVPPGTTTSYGALARRIGNPPASRAVGTAVGDNPVSWLIPCHRVLRADGGIGGYAWGVERKKTMLVWETLQRG